MANWNIGETNNLGFSGDYSKKIQDALDAVYNRQYNDSLNTANEASISGGSFNPNLSNYYATKGARDSSVQGVVQKTQASREDEFKRFNVMNAINNFDLQNQYLELQKQQYEDSKPGFWDDLLSGISTVSGVLPFLSKGGKVPNSEYIHSVYDSIIPPGEINTAPAKTGDNVMIMAKDGERIIRPEGDKMTFGATQLINDAVKTIKSLI